MIKIKILISLNSFNGKYKNKFVDHNKFITINEKVRKDFFTSSLGR